MTTQRAPATRDSGEMINGRQAIAQVGGRELVSFDVRGRQIRLTIDLVKSLFCPKATDLEAYTFVQFCVAHRLDPHIREVYLIKYQEGAAASIVIGNQVFIRRAEEYPDFQGFQAGVISQNHNGQLFYHEGAFYLPGEKVIGGWFKGWKKSRPGFDHPVRVLFQEFVATKSDGTITKFWNQMPAVMIRKVAIGHGLREMFPTDFQGMYGEEELGITITETDRKPIEAPTGWDQLGETIPQPPALEPEAVSPSPRAAPPPASTDKRPPTQAQLKRMYAMANDRGYDHEAVRDVISACYGVSSSAQLTRAQYDELYQVMDQHLPLGDLVAKYTVITREEQPGEAPLDEHPEGDQAPLMRD